MSLWKLVEALIQQRWSCTSYDQAVRFRGYLGRYRSDPWRWVLYSV